VREGDEGVGAHEATVSEAGAAGAPAGAAAVALRPGEMVDSFAVRRLIGEGGMGRVYLARDTQLGRKVALKVLSPEIFGSATALDDFLREARITARFSHPNIVGIYAVGRHQGGPYIALEYLEGQTLKERIAAGAVGPREAARLGIAITGALQEAHAQGVLHRDLKPANVLIPRDGRLRVLDFGLARATRKEQPAPGATEQGTAGSSWEGSPYYMSPEQWVDAADTPATDIWSLGLILHELATGRHPLGDRTMNELVAQMLQPDPVRLGDLPAEVPAPLWEVISRCLDKDPAGRPSAAEVSEALEQVALRRRGGWDPARQSPYRGLQPFNEEHADLFFGREAEVDAFVERLRDEPTIAVVGPSGAGKSSFVRGGVIPRLRDQGAWDVLAIRPGDRPFQELARVITGLDGGSGSGGQAAGASPDPAALARQLRDSPDRLSLELGVLSERRGCHLLLLLDQTEELFTLVEDEQERAAFLAAVLAAADDPEEPVRVVLTVRDDFLFRLVEGTGKHAALDSVMILRTPGEQMLRQVLTRPLSAAGFRFEDPAMVEEIISSVRGEVASLPLLEFAARLLWERRDQAARLIPRAALRDIGGVAGALVNHADAVLEGLDRDGQALARQLLTRLVTAEGTRRILGREQVLDGLPGEAGEVLDRLVRARLLTVRRRRGEGEQRGPDLELAHESLVATWRRLARWLEEGREDLQFLEEVGQAAALWTRRGRRSEELWRGDALGEASRKLARCGDRAPAPVVQFLQAARGLQQRRRSRRRWITAGVMAALALVALVLAYQARVADSQRAEALRRRAEALREGARAALSQGNLLEARTKLRVALEQEDAPEARALWWRLRDEPLVWSKDFGAFLYGVTHVEDGRALAVASRDGSIYLVDTRTGGVRVLRGHDDQVFSITASARGGLLASGSWNGKVLLWDLARAKRVRSLTGHESGVFGVSFSPDGERLASSAWKGKVRLWATRSGEQVGELPGDPRGTRGVRYTPDGAHLLTWGLSGTLQLRDATSGKLARTFKGHEAMVVGAAFDAAGALLASGCKDGTVRIWQVATGRQLRVIDMPGKSSTYGLSFARRGALLATVGSDKVVRVWRVRSGELVQRLPGHTSATYAVSFSPDGEQLASAGSDRSVKLWRVGAEASGRVLSGHAAAVEGVRFSPDGRRLVSVSSDQTARIWDVGSGRQLRVLRGHTDGIFGAAISPDGRLVATAARDRLVRLWELASGRAVRTLQGHRDAARGVAFSRDGKTLVSGSSDRDLRVWDAASGQTLRTLTGHGDGILGIALDASGGRVASAGAEGVVGLWDLGAGGGSPRWLKGHRGTVVDVAFSPDGKLLASGGNDRTLRLWDTASGAQVRAMKPTPGRIYSVAFRPDGSQVAAACSDGVARTYVVATGEPALSLRGHTDEVNNLSYSPDGKLLATGGDDGTVRLWDASTGRPRWWAPLLLPGGENGVPTLLTHLGWQRLAGEADQPPAQDRGWRRAVQRDASRAVISADGRLLCVMAAGDALELWDPRADRRLARHVLQGTREVAPLGDGCVALVQPEGSSGGKLVVVRPGAEPRALSLAGDVDALGGGGGELLVAAGGKLEVLDAGGSTRRQRSVDPGVTALARAAAGSDGGGLFVVGYGNGSMELLPADPARPAPGYSFEQVPSSPVMAIARGPMRTVVAGFASGVVGIWNQDDGKRLEFARLHGPVTRLLLSGRRLYAVSDLGQHLSWDLGVFHGSRCEVLREVWKRVPARWQSGRPLASPAPADHACAAP